jgi:hypothetical protein
MSRKGVKVEPIKIRCRHCDIRQTCELRARKESYEKEGWLTYCSATPNRPRSSLKNKRNKADSQK